MKQNFPKDTRICFENQIFRSMMTVNAASNTIQNKLLILYKLADYGVARTDSQHQPGKTLETVRGLKVTYTCNFGELGTKGGTWRKAWQKTLLCRLPSVLEGILSRLRSLGRNLKNWEQRASHPQQRRERQTLFW